MATNLWGPSPGPNDPSRIPSRGVDLFATPLAPNAPEIEIPQPQPEAPTDRTDVQAPIVGQVDDADKIKLFQGKVAPLASASASAPAPRRAVPAEDRKIRDAFSGEHSEIAAALDRIKGQIAPPIPSAALVKLHALLEKQQFDAAFAEVGNLMRLSPDSPEPDFRAGHIALHVRQPERARPSFEAAIAKGKVQTQLLNELAQLQQKAGRSREAQQAAVDAAKINKQIGEAHYFAGTAAYLGGDQEGAIANWKSATRFDAQLIPAYVALTKLSLRRGEKDRAMAALQELLRINPNYGDAYNDLGMIYLDGGQPDKAEAAFRQALRLNPQDSNAHNNLGVLHYDRQEWTKAEHALRASLQLDPRHAQAHFNLARLAMQQLEPEKAGLLLQKAIALDPSIRAQVKLNPLFAPLKSNPTYGHLLAS